MNINSIGFIGGGRVTRILLRGFKTAGVNLPRVVVSDTNPEALDAVRAIAPNVQSAGADNAQAAAQDLVFLALHPPAIGGVAPTIKPALRPEAVLVSLAPKFTMAKLSELLGGFSRLARMIPNAPSIIGAGYNPLACGAGLNATDKQALTSFLAPLGECPEVAESKLEGYALLTAMGPTYLWFQLQTLRKLALEFGLDDAEVTPALKRTVCGSARTLLDSGLSPADVMDLIPVKPLAEDEPGITQAYRLRLTALFQKLKA